VTGETGSDPADLLAGQLLQLAAVTERLGAIDAREGAHYQDILTRLGDLGDTLATLGEGQSGLAVALAALDGIDERVADLARQYASGHQDGNGRAYKPVPPPPWWRLPGGLDGRASPAGGPAWAPADTAAAMDRLRDWVTRIYLPGYGHLAGGLGECWDRHPLCLYILDWLSELWAALYLSRPRTAATLAGQADFQTRLLPAAAGQLSTETSKCTRHAAGGNGSTGNGVWAPAPAEPASPDPWPR
jgi:hypothetical protein